MNIILTSLKDVYLKYMYLNGFSRKFLSVTWNIVGFICVRKVWEQSYKVYMLKKTERKTVLIFDNWFEKGLPVIYTAFEKEKKKEIQMN